VRGETLVEVARAWIKSYTKAHCSSRTDEVICSATGGGDMDSDGKLEKISRDEHSWEKLVCECWFAVIV
jgi:hypothetical protein